MKQKAFEIIKKRRNDAEYLAEKHKKELCDKYPKYADICDKLSKTGLQVVYSMGNINLLESIKKQNKALQNEKESLLKELGIPTDYDKVKYYCEKCKDTGVIEEFDEQTRVSYGTKYCECFKELLNQLNTEEMARKTPLQLSTFEDFDLNLCEEKTKLIYKSCVRYAENFSINSKSLFFYGKTGLGKTHLSLAIANEIIKKGYNVVYGSAGTFLNNIEDEKFGRQQGNTENELINADLLILDDLGMEFHSNLSVSILYNLINARMRKPTIISSNLNLKDLSVKYPESIVSRILGKYALIEFVGKDKRQLDKHIKKDYN